MAPTPVTLNGLEGYSQVAAIFKCNSATICAAFYQISTDGVLALSLGDSWASCTTECVGSLCICLVYEIFNCFCPKFSQAPWLETVPRIQAKYKPESNSHVLIEARHTLLYKDLWHAILAAQTTVHKR